MHNLLSKSIYHSSLAKAALLAAMALCGATTPAQAQEEVGGKFTLQGNARLGDKILAPGSYLFTIEPASSAQALGAIPAAGTPVVFIVRPEKLAGPTTVVFAMASRTGKPNPSAFDGMTKTDASRMRLRTSASGSDAMLTCRCPGRWTAPFRPRCATRASISEAIGPSPAMTRSQARCGAASAR